VRDEDNSRAQLLAELADLRREVAALRQSGASPLIAADAASYRDLVQSMNSIVLRWDPEGRILFLNDYGQRFFGYTDSEIIGRSVVGLIVPQTETSGRDLAHMIEDLLHHPENYVSNENENMRKDGARVWVTWRNHPRFDDAGRLVEILSTGIDTSERKRAEEDLRHLSTHDNLTGLFNTRYLYGALERLIAAYSVDGGCFSLVFIDIDDFKQVVDTHGHLNGSRIIQEVGATIQAAIDEPGFGVAYAGDEFVVVLPGFGKGEALAKAEDIRSRLAAATYLLAWGREVRLSASLGVATFPDDARNLESLMGLADQALFGVKRRGKNAVAATITSPGAGRRS
jgi:diguanylate cyclase (GGDEF)-like protein/PAS domain S-box-containing protein